MDKRYRVNGLFILEVNAKDMRDAQETAERILANSGIEGYVVEVEEVLTRQPRQRSGDTMDQTRPPAHSLCT